MNNNGGLAATKRRVDEWLTTRPRVTAAVYFVVLTAAWGTAQFFVGRGGLPQAVLFGAIFASVYVGLLWFWGGLGDDAGE